MKCNTIIGQLDAWIDRELPPGAVQMVERHLEQCPACRKEAGIRACLIRAMDALPAVPAPEGFSRQVCKALHARLEYPDLGQWWRNLTLAWRSAVCGATLAGLLFGAVLGTSLASTLDTDTPSTPYQTLYDAGRLYP